MDQKPTYEELEQKIKDLENSIIRYNNNNLAFLNKIEDLDRINKCYNSLMENTEDAILISDNNGKPQAFNSSYKRKMKELLGIDMRPGIQPHKLLKDADAIKYWDSLHQKVLKGESFRSEYTHKIGENKVCHFETTFCPILKNDKVIGFTEITRDVTERRQMEKMLHANEREKSAILDAMSELVAYQDLNHTVLWANRAAAESVHEKKDNLKGKKCYEIWAGRKERCKACPVAKAIETGSVYSNKFKTPDKRTWIITGHPVKGENGEIIGAVEVTADITKSDFLEDQLRQSQKMEALGILAGGIAHDFNNMLGVIAGNVSYALSILNKNNELFEVLSDVQVGANRSTSLAQQLLTFAKGGAPIKKATDIQAVIKETANFVTRGAKTKCEFEFSDDLWITEIDEGQIDQAIGNLIINANQAMPDGGTIQIRTENHVVESESRTTLPPGNYVKIIIEDEGIGISDENLLKIFVPYFSTKQKGSGLGLATTYSIIKRHEGYISVDSTADVGTRFTIFLPASKRTVYRADIIQEVSHKGCGKILIMDDQESILKMLKRMLNSMGYETDFATDGSQAIEIYRNALHTQKPFDAVILDLTVPGGMGGEDTISELLKIDSKVKAVVSSGYSNDPIMANHVDYGFCGVLSKPYTKAQLAEILDQILTKKQ